MFQIGTEEGALLLVAVTPENVHLEKCLTRSGGKSLSYLFLHYQILAVRAFRSNPQPRLVPRWSNNRYWIGWCDPTLGRHDWTLSFSNDGFAESGGFEDTDMVDCYYKVSPNFVVDLCLLDSGLLF